MDQGSTSASIGGPGSEFLPEFRAIHNKLKKRFLRKPNVSEAGEQFAKLAKKMHSREEPQYEGLCHLAVARCERSLGNPSSESEALLLAARSFLKAENATRSIGCPSLEEHFQASIQSYSHAIQILEEDASNPFAATGLCFEVAEILVGLGKLSEAGTFYQVLYLNIISFLFLIQLVSKSSSEVEWTGMLNFCSDALCGLLRAAEAAMA